MEFPKILAVCPNPSIDILATIAQLVPGKVNRIIDEKHFPGGKGIHVALAVAEIAGSGDVLGIWGGPSGSWLKKECEQRNVMCSGPLVAEWNRSCYTFNSEHQGVHDTELLSPGPNLSESELKGFYLQFEKISAGFEIICLSGSWPHGAPSGAYHQLINLASNKKVFLDCSGALLQEGLKAHPYGIHVNLNEGIALTGEDDPVAIARVLGEQCTCAAITAGKDGLFMAFQGHILHANVHIDKVVGSSVGSGDCLVAGLAIATSRGYSLEDTAKFAVACGAANCLNPDLGMLKRADVEKLFGEATTRTIQ